MDGVDGTGHYESGSDVPPSSLLAIVLDTNPFAWAALTSSITLSRAVADLLVFINAHLSFNHANKVAVIASHCGRTAWLYPSPSVSNELSNGENGEGSLADKLSSTGPSNPNKYRPFALVETEIMRNLRLLFSGTKETDLLASPTSTMLSGALTLALSYINKAQIILGGSATAQSIKEPIDTSHRNKSAAGSQQAQTMTSRVLLVSVSGDLASQYIPIMNLIFAAQHSRIPIDILKLSGDTVLLQQASYTTSGIFFSPLSLPGSGAQDPSTSSTGHLSDSSKAPSKHVTQSSSDVSLLPTLLFAFLPDNVARQHLIPPTGVNVDFRAACFCHRRVVDIGFVCSICLSIFCDEAVSLEAPGAAHANTTKGDDHGQGNSLSRISETGTCLTCGTLLNLKALKNDRFSRRLVQNENSKVKKKKKKKKETSGVSTPQS